MFTPSPNTSPSRWTMSPEMNTDADVNLLGFLLFSVVGLELTLNLLGTLDGMNNRGEIHQERITDSFDDLTVMFRHRVLDDAIMHVEQPQHASFIRPHLPTKADDVSEHDRR